MKRFLLLLIALVAGMAAWAQSFTVDNNGNTFYIRRSGNNLPAQTVRYRTVSLSALDGKNFTAISGQLAFAAGDTVKSVTVQEATDIHELYHFQTGTSRSYRFEVLDYYCNYLNHVDRIIKYGTAYQHTASYVNKSVTDLVYFDSSGSLRSGTGNKYLDVSYPSSNWIQVDDHGYNQAVYTVSTDNLFHGSNELRTYLNNRHNKMYATVYFQQMEEQDGYQYIQILADNSTDMDGNDPNGQVNDPYLSLYKACFILSYDPSGSVMSDTHYQFFPHRYDYVDKKEETNAGITHYEFDYANSHLYQQKYKSTSYDAPNTGSLNLSTTVNSLNIRFDAAGSGGDDWDFKNLKLRLALVDETAPMFYFDEIKVGAGPYLPGKLFYVSIPFSEIVTTGSSPVTLITEWGEIPCVGGSGSNVLTFGGNINADAELGSTLTVYSLNGTITDLAGNELYNKNINTWFGATVTPTYSITLPASTPHGTVTSDKQIAFIGETVTLTATPDPGYALASLTVTGGDPPVEVTAGPNNTYTFTMFISDVTVDAEFALAIDSINFPDENFRNWLLEQDYGSDSLITDEEIPAITKITVYDKKIADLTGIEHFTALTWLECGGNKLTALDVSHNTALQVLRCYNNKLTTLDVSHNTALFQLYCERNPLTALDLSHNTALRDLDCEYCALTSLVIGQNTTMTSLTCEYNQLTSLDVSGCSALRKLTCYHNQLTSLDISGCNSLIYFYIYVNQINSENMEAVVEALPVTTDPLNSFRVFHLYDTTERNVITARQVAAARAKGWNVRTQDNSGYGGVLEPGDLNGDGMVDVGDVNIMINVVLDVIAVDQLAGNPDLDGSGVVDVADVNLLINLVLSD